MKPPDALVSRLGSVWQLISDVRALWPLISDKRPLLVLLVCLGLVTTLAEGAGLGLGLIFVYRLFKGDAGDETGFIGGILQALPQGASELVLLGVLTSVMFLVKTSLSAVYRILVETISAAAVHRTRSAVFEQFLNADYPYVADRGASLLVNTLEWETAFVPAVILKVAEFFISVCAFVSYGLYLFVVSWRIGLVAMALGAILIVTLGVAARKLAGLSAKVVADNESLAKVTIASMQGLRTIRLFAAEAKFHGDHAQRSALFAESSRRLGILESLVGSTRQMLMFVMMGVFLFMLWWLRSGVATDLAAIALLYRLFPHVTAAEQQVVTLFSMAAPIHSVARALALNRRADAGCGELEFGGVFEAITFEDVVHSYNAQRDDSLRGVNLAFPAGSFTAILGPSGGGKTTIVSLLGRLYVPNAGAIMVDGVPLSEFSRKSWFASVAFAGQDVELIEGSVLENVLIGRDNISDDAVLKALEIAGADFISALPKGLQSEIGDRGAHLSGGQRQRIGLARALVGLPKLLVMDEATNAIDPELELAVYAAIRTAMPALTLIVVTHRGDVSAADQTFIIDGGLVVSRVSRSTPSRGLPQTSTAMRT